MDKPSQNYNPAPRSSSSSMPDHIADPSLKGDAFNQLLQNRGIRFIHSIAINCPNLNALNENAHNPECSFCDNSQIIHLPGKEIWGVFTNNSLEKMFEVQGVWEIGTAVITFPTEYNDALQADFNTYDKLVCPDFQIRLSDLKEYSPSSNNTLYLRYPVIKVQNITSVRNNALYTHIEGVDYILNDSGIKWLIPPRYDTINEIGEVLSITYITNPVYTVLNVMHELRVTQEYDILTGMKIARRLPQQVLVKRDFLLNDKANAK